jgi:hypothetical protein
VVLHPGASAEIGERKNDGAHVGSNREGLLIIPLGPATALAPPLGASASLAGSFGGGGKPDTTNAATAALR